MSKTLVEIVVDTLNAEGISAVRAYPAGKMLAIDNLYAAVGLKELDSAAGTETVKVFMLVPAKDGASVCEDAGLRVCRLLRAIGGSCRQGEAIYDSRGDFLYVPIEAVFAGQETMVGWDEQQPAPTFSVKVENVVLENVVSFDAEYALVETELLEADAQWTFRLEELTPLNRQEEEMPEEPFSIAVVKEYSAEVYSGCRITGRKRLFREDGLHHIWEGTADAVTVVT